MNSFKESKFIRGMWALWDSLDWVAWSARIFAAGIAFAGLLVFVLTWRKDHLTSVERAREKQQLEARISENNLRTAEAEKETVRLTLELEQSRKEILLLKRQQAPRYANQRFEDALKERKAGTAEIYFDASSFESRNFAGSLYACLAEAGWTVGTPMAYPENKWRSFLQAIESLPPFYQIPESSVVAGVAPTGGKIVIQTDGDLELPKRPYDGDSPISALLRALEIDEISAVLASGDSLQLLPVTKGTIRIVVGKRE